MREEHGERDKTQPPKRVVQSRGTKGHEEKRIEVATQVNALKVGFRARSKSTQEQHERARGVPPYACTSVLVMPTASWFARELSSFADEAKLASPPPEASPLTLASLRLALQQQEQRQRQREQRGRRRHYSGTFPCTCRRIPGKQKAGREHAPFPSQPVLRPPSPRQREVMNRARGGRKSKRPRRQPFKIFPHSVRRGYNTKTHLTPLTTPHAPERAAGPSPFPSPPSRPSSPRSGSGQEGAAHLANALQEF